MTKCVSNWLILLLAVALGLAFRLPQLERRPLHTDEAVHGIKLGELIERGRYVYDPHDYHGPTLYYFTLPVAWLRGEHTLAQLSATTLRLVPVMFGVGVILLCVLAGSVMGKWEAAWAAVFTAVSPMMVFYSRYYIQETLLVFFTFGLLLAGWRWWETGKLVWVVLAGLCAGLMHASKETCVITWLGMGVAWVCSQPRSAAEWRKENTPLRSVPHYKHLVIAALVAVLVSVICFTAFFTHGRGALESVTTYAKYFQRGQGSGHEKAWWYYFEIFGWHKAGGFVWTELAIVVLAIAGSVRAFRERLAFGKFLTVYAAVMMAVYAVIPYKTPWSWLTVAHGLVLLGGIGAVGLLRIHKLAIVLLLAALVNLGIQARRGNFRFASDERNPWVYTHTSPDAVRLAERVNKLAAKRPIVVKVMAKEYWPLPWYWRALPAVGYWNAPAETADADVVVASPEFGIEMGEKYVASLYGLRPGVILEVFVRKDL